MCRAANIAASATIAGRNERSLTAVGRVSIAIAVASVASPHMADGTGANASGILVSACVSACTAVQCIGSCQ